MALPEGFTPPKRECDGCTACCEGWLHAEALGHSFFPGQPCHWKSCDGCTVYEDRPAVCRDFVCAWKAGHFLPMWFKPTESNVICKWLYWKNKDEIKEGETGLYLSITECGKPITTQCLTWLNSYTNAEALNIRYQYQGRWHWAGSDEFDQWNMNGAIPPTGHKEKDTIKEKK